MSTLEETMRRFYETCRNCDAPAEKDGVCLACWRDPESNDCAECGRHLSGINYPYVCGDCLRAQLR